MSVNGIGLNRFWKPLFNDIEEQKRLWASTARFKIVPAGRRSGKTEILGKQSIVLRACFCHDYDSCVGFGHPEWFIDQEDPKIAAAAPTRDQAKRIYWADFKKMVPKYMLSGPPNESSLFIPLRNGAALHVLGMDRPERVEGSPWDHICLDEYGNMKKETWDEHLEPALNTVGREGSCDFIGVPEGRNHYYHLFKDAQAMLAEGNPDWDTFTWFSSLVLSEAAITRARRNLDELTFQQEYEGSFVNFSGQAYYNFKDGTHCAPLKQYYNPDAPLIVALDFNVQPGIAAIGQEMQKLDPVGKVPIIGETMTGWFHEVYVPRNSNTIIVCDKVGNDFKEHRGEVHVYGDASGGARGSAKVLGSDWELAKQTLRKHLGERVKFFVPRANPGERERVNAVNSRLFTTSQEVNMMVDPSGAPKTVIDFEGVRVIEGGSGEIDKKYDLSLTHLTDGIGYYIHKEFPIAKLDGGMIDVIGA